MEERRKNRKPIQPRSKWKMTIPPPKFQLGYEEIEEIGETEQCEEGKEIENDIGTKTDAEV